MYVRTTIEEPGKYIMLWAGTFPFSVRIYVVVFFQKIQTFVHCEDKSKIRFQDLKMRDIALRT